MGAFTVKSPSLRQRRHLSSGYALRDTSVRLKREKRKQEVAENGSSRFRSPLRRKTVASPSTTVVTGAPAHAGPCRFVTLLFAARCSSLFLALATGGAILGAVVALTTY